MNLATARSLKDRSTLLPRLRRGGLQSSGSQEPVSHEATRTATAVSSPPTVQAVSVGVQALGRDVARLALSKPRASRATASRVARLSAETINKRTRLRTRLTRGITP